VPRDLVAAVAERLMDATVSSAAQASEQVLGQLVEHFSADASFLRYEDQGRRTLVLVAKWPPRPDIADPDPLAVIQFADADPVSAVCEQRRNHW
jgi:diguanylate cyclase